MVWHIVPMRYDWGFTKEDVFSVWSAVAAFLGDLCLAEVERLVFGGGGTGTLTAEEKQRERLRAMLREHGDTVIPKYCSRFFFDGAKLLKLRGPRGVDRPSGDEIEATSGRSSKGKGVRRKQLEAVSSSSDHELLRLGPLGAPIVIPML